MASSLSGISTIVYDNTKTTPEAISIKGKSFYIGNVAPGEKSNIVIVALSVPNVSQIDNIKLGLTDNGTIAFRSATFGITSSSTFDPNINPLTYFQGINSDSEVDSQYNFNVDRLNKNESEYVYIKIDTISTQKIGSGAVRFKWFFDYD